MDSVKTSFENKQNPLGRIIQTIYLLCTFFVQALPFVLLVVGVIAHVSVYDTAYRTRGAASPFPVEPLLLLFVVTPIYFKSGFIGLICAISFWKKSPRYLPYIYLLVPAISALLSLDLVRWVVLIANAGTGP